MPTCRASLHCDQVWKVWFAISARSQRHIVRWSWGRRLSKAHIRLRIRGLTVYVVFAGRQLQETHSYNFMQWNIRLLSQPSNISGGCSDILTALITSFWTCSVCSGRRRNLQCLRKHCSKNKRRSKDLCCPLGGPKAPGGLFGSRC